MQGDVSDHSRRTLRGHASPPADVKHTSSLVLGRRPWPGVADLSNFEEAVDAHSTQRRVTHSQVRFEREERRCFFAEHAPLQTWMFRTDVSMQSYPPLSFECYDERERQTERETE